tara:strand:- start:134 stop:295 length:162 start_codon:yes stop_codon:yes gene_type:complete
MLVLGILSGLGAKLPVVGILPGGVIFGLLGVTAGLRAAAALDWYGLAIFSSSS